MNKLKITSLIGGLALLVFGCEDPDLGPILTFENAGKGAYVRLIEESDKLINILTPETINASEYVYSVEFVDVQQGDLVQDYVLDLVYSNVETGDDTEVTGFRTFQAGDFVELASGNKGLNNITITANEVIQAAGITPDQVNAGDQFTLVGTINLEDGSTFGQDNSTAAIIGPSFRGHFNFTLPAGCPSDLTGEYAYETTEIWCGGGNANGTVEIEAQGGGVYKFSDWAFGSYGVCYGGGSAGGDLTFTDVCNEVAFTGFTDSFGDTWTFTSEIDPADNTRWIIGWENTYGESASSVVINPAGWNITIVE